MSRVPEKEAQINIPVRPDLDMAVRQLHWPHERMSKARFSRHLYLWALLQYFKAGSLDRLLGKGVGEEQLYANALAAAGRFLDEHAHKRHRPGAA